MQMPERRPGCSTDGWEARGPGGSWAAHLGRVLPWAGCRGVPGSGPSGAWGSLGGGAGGEGGGMWIHSVEGALQLSVGRDALSGAAWGQGCHTAHTHGSEALPEHEAWGTEP